MVAVALIAPVQPLAGSGPLGFSQALAADSEEELISRGVGLRKAGSDQEAMEVFRQAYREFHSPRSAAQLGLSEQAVGRWDEAEAHLVEALRADGDPWIRKNREALTGALAVVKTHIARLEILGTPEGAEVLVNGKVVGRLPLSTPIGTSAGEVDVETRALGYKPEIRKLELKGGQYQRLVVRLERTTTPPGAAADGREGPAAAVAVRAEPTAADGPRDTGAGRLAEVDHPSGQPPTSAFRKAAKWTSLGLAVGGLGVGVGASLVRSTKYHQLASSPSGQCYDDNGRAVDVNGDPVPWCQDPLDTYHATRPWQIAGFISAGVFATTWLVLLLTEPDEPAPSATAQTARRALACGPSADLRGASCAFVY